MPVNIGSPDKPAEMKCTTICCTGPGQGYQCIVFEDGSQVYAKLRPTATLLWGVQIAEFNATIPGEEVKGI